MKENRERMLNRTREQKRTSEREEQGTEGTNTYDHHQEMKRQQSRAERRCMCV